MILGSAEPLAEEVEFPTVPPGECEVCVASFIIYLQSSSSKNLI